jgi:hypothetical protein
MISNNRLNFALIGIVLVMAIFSAALYFDTDKNNQNASERERFGPLAKTGMADSTANGDGWYQVNGKWNYKKGGTDIVFGAEQPVNGVYSTTSKASGSIPYRSGTSFQYSQVETLYNQEGVKYRVNYYPPSVTSNSPELASIFTETDKNKIYFDVRFKENNIDSYAHSITYNQDTDASSLSDFATPARTVVDASSPGTRTTYEYSGGNKLTSKTVENGITTTGGVTKASSTVKTYYTGEGTLLSPTQLYKTDTLDANGNLIKRVFKLPNDAQGNPQGSLQIDFSGDTPTYSLLKSSDQFIEFYNEENEFADYSKEEQKTMASLGITKDNYDDYQSGLLDIDDQGRVVDATTRAPILGVAAPPPAPGATSPAAAPATPPPTPATTAQAPAAQVPVVAPSSPAPAAAPQNIWTLNSDNTYQAKISGKTINNAYKVNYNGQDYYLVNGKTYNSEGAEVTTSTATSSAAGIRVMSGPDKHYFVFDASNKQKYSFSENPDTHDVTVTKVGGTSTTYPAAAISALGGNINWELTNSKDNGKIYGSNENSAYLSGNTYTIFDTNDRIQSKTDTLTRAITTFNYANARAKSPTSVSRVQTIGQGDDAYTVTTTAATENALDSLTTTTTIKTADGETITTTVGTWNSIKEQTYKDSLINALIQNDQNTIPAGDFTKGVPINGLIYKTEGATILTYEKGATDEYTQYLKNGNRVIVEGKGVISAQGVIQTGVVDSKATIQSEYNPDGEMVARTFYTDETIPVKVVTRWDGDGLRTINYNDGATTLTEIQDGVFQDDTGFLYDAYGNQIKEVTSNSWFGDDKTKRYKRVGDTADQQIAKAVAESNRAERGRAGGYAVTANYLQTAAEWTKGYSGFRMFYDEPQWLIEMDETMMNILGGIEGWSAELCKMNVLDDFTTENGYAFSDSVSGASAHIEGEKLTMTKYSNESVASTVNFYKVSFAVNPGSSVTGCDIKFRVFLKGSDSIPLIVHNNSNTAYQFDIKRGDSPIAFTGQNMVVRQSNKDYTKVCITFDEIIPKSANSCLIGIDEGSDLCNKIVPGAEYSYGPEDFDCDNCGSTFAQIFSFGGSGAGGGSVGSVLPAAGSQASTGPQGQDRPNVGPVVNPNI